MSKELASKLSPQEQFEANIKARLTKDIGDLIPDDVLKSMVDKAMQKAFFEDQIVTTGSYSRNEVRKPAEFVEIIKQLMRERVKISVDSWVTENQDKVMELFEQIVKDGMTKTVLEHLDMSLGYAIRANLGQALSKAFPDRDWSSFHY